MSGRSGLSDATGAGRAAGAADAAPDRPAVWSLHGSDDDGTDVIAEAGHTDRTASAAFQVDVAQLSLAQLDDHLRVRGGRAPQVVRVGGRIDVASLHAMVRSMGRLQEQGTTTLVLDGPVLAGPASASASAADVRAWRSDLLALAGAAVCTLDEARRWLGDAVPDEDAPSVARRLREAGVRAVCVVGEAAGFTGCSPDWLDCEHARGWLAGAPTPPAAHRAVRSLFAAHLAAAITKGFVVADAAVLAHMATADSIRRGPDAASRVGAADGIGFVGDPGLLPLLSWDEAPCVAPSPAAPRRRLDLYAVVDGAERVMQVLDAGIRTVQLRIKSPQAPDAAWHALLRSAVRRSIAACDAAGAELFVNDHWRLAAELGAHGVHLGQEDLLALGDAGRSALQARGLALGISSHSLWELCRARTLAPRYVACGPVWPTLTKAMPWQAQGLDNLAWWCRMAQVPVVAIGGVLEAAQVRQAAACGADGVCIVRGLGDDPGLVVPQLQRALDAGRADFAASAPSAGWPHPSLRSD